MKYILILLSLLLFPVVLHCLINMGFKEAAIEEFEHDRLSERRRAEIRRLFGHHQLVHDRRIGHDPAQTGTR